ncbi:hypothetical protein [Nostoc sp.]
MVVNFQGGTVTSDAGLSLIKEDRAQDHQIERRTCVSGITIDFATRQ